MVGKTQFTNFQHLLWEIDDFIHRNGPPHLFESEILVIFALKRLSDAFEEGREKMSEAGINSQKTDCDIKLLAPGVDKDNSNFFLPKIAMWSNLQNISHNIGIALNKAICAVEAHNPALNGLLRSADFSKSEFHDHNLRDLLALFAKYGLRNRDLESPEMLRGVFNYLMQRFAESRGGACDEIFAPGEVAALLLLQR